MKKNDDGIALALGGKTFIDEVFETSLSERKIYLNTAIDENIVETAMAQILKWNKEDKGVAVEERQPIKLYINSVGGSVFEGLVLCDIIKNSKTPVHGVVLAYGYSMGCIIFLATHKRFMFENSSLLIHDGQTALSGSANKVKDIQMFYTKLDERLKKIVLDNSTITSREYNKNADREQYLLADECKKKGLCHFIIGQDCELEEVI